MIVLLDERIERTLDRIVREWSDEVCQGTNLEVWLFEDEKVRRAAEERLLSTGVRARLRSAYKPLVHAFLEEIPTAGLKRATIRYPVHDEARENRFLSETYPLAALLDQAELVFEPGGADLTYDVMVEYQDGRVAEHRIFAPNRLRANHLGDVDLTPTGWIRAAGLSHDDLDEFVETENEQVFHKAVAAIIAHDWPAQEPYAEMLAIDVAVSGIERPLWYGDEVMSTREALHEDLYFSTLEFFRHKSGRETSDRSLRPGQIVPDIHAADGDAHVRVTIQTFLEPSDPERSEQDLERAVAAPSLSQIHRELAALPGDAFESLSREGRPVRGIYRSGARPAVLLTSGQHANETSGPVGAFRAVRRLLAKKDSNVAFIPVENPDGYALHGRLCESNPRHMHHAARYTALGNDLEFSTEDSIYEIGARRQALKMSDAQLHINLHGYPAHEWTRPFTGYLPHGFESWAIPKGFFLILSYHSSWADVARKLIEAVTRGLSAVPGLADLNRQQLRIGAIHSGETPYEVINGIPCLVTAQERYPTPLTLITEFPDETIYGEAYRLAHTVQMATVIAAEEAYAAILEAMA